MNDDFKWTKADLADMRQQRDELIKSIEFWSRPGATFGAITMGGQARDGTADQIADLQAALARVERLIEVIALEVEPRHV